jgi:hypothetical protein
MPDEDMGMGDFNFYDDKYLIFPFKSKGIFCQFFLINFSDKFFGRVIPLDGLDYTDKDDAKCLPGLKFDMQDFEAGVPHQISYVSGNGAMVILGYGSGDIEIRDLSKGVSQVFPDGGQGRGKQGGVIF